MLLNIRTRLFSCLAFLLVAGTFNACKVFRRTVGSAKNIPQEAATAKEGKEDNTAIKNYHSVITGKALSQRGLLTIHQVGDKYYFEVPDSVLNTDILLVSRISRTGWSLRKQMDGYAGDPIGQEVIRFEKGPRNKMFIREIRYRNYEPNDSTTAMFDVIERNNVAAIAAAFQVKAITPDSAASVIDVTEYIEGDNTLFGFSHSSSKTKLGLKEFQPDRSYVNYVRSFPTNVEINSTRTYKQANGSATLELNTSLVQLPKDPMQPRFYDPRVGFIAIDRTDYVTNPHGVTQKELITRWRLEPRAEDQAAYFNGELVEPKKPIVFYIDPATPEKWIPYLIQGVNDWQETFEQAGFKNAIMGKRAPTPEEDSTWSLLDARHSAIVYKPSQTMNASGPHIHDPRTGEILESHINWYHNVMELLQTWYFIQAGAVDPEAQSMQFSDELMGELMRFVAAHEVGHTLGLAHNWAASSTVPVENLRDREWLRRHGHTPSIMDYARFNYVAQPEDSIGRHELFPHIGEYDKWAIEWGYRLMPGVESAEQEHPLLRKITTERLNGNERLLFVKESYRGMDPRTQNEDLGDDALKASAYGIKNLKRILPRLSEWTRKENEDYADLLRMYNLLIRQLELYYMHVGNQVAGTYFTAKMVEQPGPVYQSVPRSYQKAAIAFLDEQLFTTPLWLVDSILIHQTTSNPLDVIGRMQEKVLKRIAGTRLSVLLKAEAIGEPELYSPVVLLEDLRKIIFRELNTKSTIDVYRRNLQRIYIDHLTLLVSPRKGSGALTLEELGQELFRESGAVAILKGELRQIHTLIIQSVSTTKDTSTKYHLQDISDKILRALDPGQ